MGTTTFTSTPRLNWRVVDMVTATILGVTCDLTFLVWNQIGGLGYPILDAPIPGIGSLAPGVWPLGGTFGGLIIRKSGAAIPVEVIVASVSAAPGFQWGIGALYSGIVQGPNAELTFLIFMYRRYNASIAALSGLGAGVAVWVLELLTVGNLAMGSAFFIAYLVRCTLSSLALGGLVVWLLAKAFTTIGALDRFAAGCKVRARV